ncbi:MAG TPA: DEAD/DEAH box helicase [Vampirovibrionales bacterium]
MTFNSSIDPQDIFPFQLDDFQLDAIKGLQEECNVLVCAPTGAGKTVIAEYAMHEALRRNKKIFYTTPLKALSNQKFHDLCKQFGEDKVGLLTGDVQHNREADILVLTTEIFRNMLYKAEEEKNLFERIGYAVLDECHYMKDPDRGTVWEESIIYCPSEAQIIALSATVGNPQDVSSWMQETHGRKTRLIHSDFRPVPLRFFFYGRDGMKPLNKSGGGINKNILKGASKGGKNSSSGNLPKISDVLGDLKQKDMLPAIYFVFSRKGCERALQYAVESKGVNLLTEAERREVKEELKEVCKQLPWLRTHRHYYALLKGASAHHAGLLPALKGVVEKLFQKNLIKVVFATETLAAGINMPARSVVISQISKRSDSGHRLLNGSEFMQMSGRAGRRGMDEIGYVTVMETRFEGAWEICELSSTPAEELTSSFTPNYIMVLNLAANFNWDKCRELVMKSFARYQNRKQLLPLQNLQLQLAKNLNKKTKPKNKKDDEKYFQKTRSKLKRIEAELSFKDQEPWPGFEQAAKVLQHFEYLKGDYKPTEKGIWTADLRGDNVLLFAEVIEKGNLSDLSEIELAGFICALSCYEIRWDYKGSGWMFPEAIDEAMKRSFEIIKQLSVVQHKFDCTPRMPFNPALIEVGYDWACGFDWEELVEKYRCDEGDIVKVLKQAADMLKQIVSCKGASMELVHKANKAFELIYCSPIKDDFGETS